MEAPAGAAPAAARVGQVTPAAAPLVALLAAGIGAPLLDRTLLEALLSRAGEYVIAYDKDASGVVLEESYQQSLRRGSTVRSRLIVSDFVLVSLADHAVDDSGAPESGLLGFRDVFRVDGEVVRDREARLERLFLRPSSEGLEQVREILDEGARYNLGAIVRNFNFPTVALVVLRPQVQRRFAFKDKGGKAVRGRVARRVEYEEKARPTLVRDPVRDEDQFSRGAFLLDLETGAVLQSEFRIQERRGSSSVAVEFRRDEELGLWLPFQMTETNETLATGFVPSGTTVRVAGGEVLTAVARYSNARRFGVTTEEKVIAPQEKPGPPR